MNCYLLCVKVAICTKVGEVRTNVENHSAAFSYSTLRILYSHADIYMTGGVISHGNPCYLHAAFIGSEPTNDTEKKETSVKKGRVIIIWQKQIGKIERSLNFSHTSTAKNISRQSSTVQYCNISRFFWNRNGRNSGTRSPCSFASQQYTASHEKTRRPNRNSIWQNTISH